MRQNVLFFGVITSFLFISALSFAQTITLTPLSQSTWNEWRPRHNNDAVFNVTVTGVSSEGTVTFHLDNVSRWVGYCMNDGDGTAPDLELDADDQNADAAYGITWSSNTDKQTMTATWNSQTTPSWLNSNTGTCGGDGACFGSAASRQPTPLYWELT